MPFKSLSQEELRDRFRKLMGRLGWSVTETAVQLLGSEKRQPEVTKWLTMVRPIPDKYLMKIAERAGESLDYFLPITPADSARAAKLLAAEMMEKMAAQLRDEAGAGSSAAPAAVAREALETTQAVDHALEPPVGGKVPPRRAGGGRGGRRP